MSSPEHSAPSTPPTSSLLLPTDSSRSTQSSPPRSPQRLQTDPEQHSTPDLQQKPFKRIVVFCDGTWQDGVAEQQRSLYTNVLRLARTVSHEDKRYTPPIMQVVFYQSGIGSDKNLYSTYVEGTTGDTLGDKVEEAYAFIAHNFHAGDEIFLFGFSRGAYTARMVATFIGEIGVLDRQDMDSFASIFLNYQNFARCGNDPDKRKDKQQLEKLLSPWRDPLSKGHQRASANKDKFTIKCVGVWDTVGDLGIPVELSMSRNKKPNLFGFDDKQLGAHIEHAYQALAINEMRKDFDCTKWQKEAGSDKRQILKQCWFTGCHSDIGGGYKRHDLSDLTLVWMAAQIEHLLCLDVQYLQKLISPVAPWGKQRPHDSETGIFRLAESVHRKLPTAATSLDTHETVHSSVLEQEQPNPDLIATLRHNSALIDPLTELERQIKDTWPYDKNSPQAQAYAAKLAEQKHAAASLTVTKTTSWFKTLVRSVSSRSNKSGQGSTFVTQMQASTTTTTQLAGTGTTATGVPVEVKSSVVTTTGIVRTSQSQN